MTEQQNPIKVHVTNPQVVIPPRPRISVSISTYNEPIPDPDSNIYWYTKILETNPNRLHADIATKTEVVYLFHSLTAAQSFISWAKAGAATGSSPDTFPLVPMSANDFMNNWYRTETTEELWAALSGNNSIYVAEHYIMTEGEIASRTPNPQR